MRTFDDDEDTRSSGAVAAAGDSNMRESLRRSRDTKRGLGRAAQRGNWLGGRVPDGYLRDSKRDREPTILRIDEEREGTYRRLFELGLASVGSGEAARILNREGLQSGQRLKDGTLQLCDWTPWRVRECWRKAHYASLQYHGELLPDVTGDWPALIEPADWRRLQRIMDARGEAQNRSGKRPGMATSRHLLARLCVCGLCGKPVHAFGDKPRKDGTVPRRLQCSASRDVNGTCTAPRLDAAVIERPFVRNLVALTVDLGAELEQRREGLQATREAWQARAEHERRELERLAGRASKVEAEYLRRLDAGDDDGADTFAGVMGRVKRERRQAEARLAELEAAAADTPAEPNADALLDLYHDLQRALAGHVAGDTVRDVNARLREALDRVELTPRPDGAVTIRAFLSPAFLATVDDAEGFAAVSELNGGPPVEHGPEGTLARLDVIAPAEHEVGAASPW